MGLASEGASRIFQPFHFSDSTPNMASSSQKQNQNLASSQFPQAT